jgi:hypothetical protein
MDAGNYTWIKPSNINKIKVKLLGGGGACGMVIIYW